MVCVSWLAVRPKSGRRDRPERLGAVPETDGLWGGSIVSVSFDPVAWTLRFGVAVVVGQARHRYELVLDGVSRWQASRDLPLPWNYAELTEVHVSESDDEVLVELVLWSDATSISVRCTRLRVDQLE
jgi:hypothetical protein